MFEVDFTNMLRKYPDAVSDKKVFTGLIKDYFPDKPMQVNLINTTYSLGIVEDIQKASNINNIFAFRFVKQLLDDYGINRKHADWVVSLWCVCYGQQILGKNCEVKISTANSGGKLVIVPTDNKDDKTKLYGDMFVYKSIPEGYAISGFIGNNAKTLICPGFYNGKKVTKILESAFENCDVQEAIINEGISCVESRAFKGCQNLKQVVFPNSLKIIGEEAFKDCVKLVMAVLPLELEQIGNYAFSNTDIKFLKLPNSVVFIGNGAYKDCQKLSDISLPNEITELPDELFKGCVLIKKLELPSNLQKIGNEAFADCSSLINMIIPEFVNSVGINAFKGMNSKFLLICKKNSAAEQYARKHNISFQIEL